MFIVLRCDKAGEKEKAVGNSDCFVFGRSRSERQEFSGWKGTKCLRQKETQCLRWKETPVIEEVELPPWKRGQDVTQLGDVSSCYGDLYFWFWDDRPSKSQDLAKEEF